MRMDFEAGAPGTPALGPDAWDALPEKRADTRHSTEQAFSGRQSARMTVRRGEELFGGDVHFPSRLYAGDEVWIRFRVYWPDGFDWSARPWLKFFRVHTSSPARWNDGYLDWYINNPQAGPHPPFQVIKERDDRWRTFGSDRDDPKTGVWETYEAHYVFDWRSAAEGGRARVQVWKNGVLLRDIRDIRTLSGPDSWAYRFGMHYWNGGAPRTQSWYVDDIVVTNRRPAARDAHGNPMIGTAWDRPPE